MQVQSQQITQATNQLYKQSCQPSHKCLQQLAIQTLSQQNNSQRDDNQNTDIQNNGSNKKSNKSQNYQQSQNSTQPDNANSNSYISLKSIKSKQQIQIESKQNQQILLNLNSNIDDLFRKISSLTEEITTQLKPREIHSPQRYKKQTTNIQINQNDKQIIKSTSLNSFKSLFEPLQNKIKYEPIFFQHHKFSSIQYSINMKLFQTGKSLGCGKFGQVVQCRNTKTNALYALKKIFKSVIDQYNMQQQLLTQLKILTQINHPNIVKAYQAFTDDFHIFILMEYIHGNLLVKKLKCTQNECKIIIKQVLQAIKYLHEKKIAHRDIKPQNIIITADNVVKICDFGWSSQSEQKLNILCGTLDYVSPQMVKQQEYTQNTDLWNLGVLTYELIHGYPPFKASSKSRIFEKVKNLEYTFSDQIQISEECKQFINGYLKVENQRQSIEWGLNHKFLQIQQPLANEIQKDEEIIEQFKSVIQ